MLMLGQSVSNAVENARSPVIIKSLARFQTRDGQLYLFIDDTNATNRAYLLPWGTSPDMPLHYSTSISLESNRVYTFTIITEDFKKPQAPVVKRSTVVKVERDGKIIYDREVCEVHQTKMDHRKGWVVYTHMSPGPGEPSEVTEQRLFPHRKEYSFGGDEYNPGSPRKGEVYVCSQCKKAYAKWKTEHPKKS
jgi:hypothetical protein